jgi:hypothetical protein
MIGMFSKLALSYVMEFLTCPLSILGQERWLLERGRELGRRIGSKFVNSKIYSGKDVWIPQGNMDTWNMSHLADTASLKEGTLVVRKYNLYCRIVCKGDLEEFRFHTVKVEMKCCYPSCIICKYPPSHAQIKYVPK